MHGPPLVGWLLAAVCVLSGGYCLLRARAGAPAVRRGAGSEAVMALAMAAMAVPIGAVAGADWLPLVLAVVFAGSAVREVSLLRSDRPHHAHHAVGAVAMVHMALAMAGGAPGHHGHGLPDGTGHTAVGSVLPAVLLLYFALAALRSGARLIPASGTGGAAAGWVGRPELTTACRGAMDMAMFAMLLPS
ncbi:DUF5134 domain-containing protein [Streptomyces sp. TP-A0874]|uniref:DUF5134 domain-containing protein n=1 Tax=Streptomyces sp. TP-A0874 TaxID=549819 RepID=UPI000853342E|nr:DUF5134 domain-containing protein [Streptomyces sp. TP-A0874]